MLMVKAQMGFSKSSNANPTNYETQQLLNIKLKDQNDQAQKYRLPNHFISANLYVQFVVSQSNCWLFLLHYYRRNIKEKSLRFRKNYLTLLT